ncbi:MAG: hypothetical protein ACC662_01410 [Planctomycetota bacterium]
MSLIRTDARSIPFHRQPEAAAVADETCARIHEDQIALAKALRTIDSTSHFVVESCASIGEFVLRRGLSPSQGRSLCLVGVAMHALAWVEPRLRDGSLTFDQAAVLGELCQVEGTIREEDDWETWARFWPLRRLRSLVHRRIEQVRQDRKRLIAFTTHLTREAYADFRRARTLASRLARKALTRGQALAFILRDFVHRHDPEERGAGKRRIGDTSDPSCRTVPAETIRACIDRYGDRCWVPGCTNEIFLESIHIHPNRDGGSQEPENIGRGCHRHHVLFDAGKIWIVGLSERGLPIFETEDGRILHPDHPGCTLRKSAVQPEGDTPRPVPAPASSAAPSPARPDAPSPAKPDAPSPAPASLAPASPAPASAAAASSAAPSPAAPDAPGPDAAAEQDTPRRSERDDPPGPERTSPPGPCVADRAAREREEAPLGPGGWLTGPLEWPRAPRPRPRAGICGPP